MAENTEPHAATDDIGPDPSLLLVDDDAPFLRRLARAMETRGFAVHTAESVAEGIAKAKTNPPKFAVVDLRLGDGSGLDVIAAIRRLGEIIDRNVSETARRLNMHRRTLQRILAKRAPK